MASDPLVCRIICRVESLDLSGLDLGEIGEASIDMQNNTRALLMFPDGTTKLQTIDKPHIGE